MRRHLPRAHQEGCFTVALTLNSAAGLSVVTVARLRPMTLDSGCQAPGVCVLRLWMASHQIWPVWPQLFDLTLHGQLCRTWYYKL